MDCYQLVIFVNESFWEILMLQVQLLGFEFSHSCKWIPNCVKQADIEIEYVGLINPH